MNTQSKFTIHSKCLLVGLDCGGDGAGVAGVG
jgi:hypothetical protein